MKVFSRKFVTRTFVALAVLGLFAVPASSAVEVPEVPHVFEAVITEPTYIFDTPEGIVAIPASELDAELLCIVQAPESSSCKNGPVCYCGWSAGHGVLFPPPDSAPFGVGLGKTYAYRFLSFLTTASTTRQFQCDVQQLPNDDAAYLKCHGGSGSFPARGSQMSQTAYALAGGKDKRIGDKAVEQFAQGNVIAGLGAMGARLIY